VFDPEDDEIVFRVGRYFFEEYDTMLLREGGTGRAECVSYYKRPKTKGKKKKRTVRVCVCV